jgi:hypothetical protein
MGDAEPKEVLIAVQAAQAALAGLQAQAALRARQDGALGNPDPGAGEWSATEREVLEILAAQRLRHDAARRAVAAQLEADLQRLAPPAFAAGGHSSDAQLELRLIAGRLGPELSAAARRARRAASELEAFREAHRLARPAIYPQSRLLQAGLLVFAALFEAAFSAALFAETDDRGLLGGAMIALGLSGANVSLGFLAGFLGLRYLGSRARTARVIGAGGLIGLTGLAVSLNVFAAHWRDMLSTGERSALDTLNAASWFGLITPQAVILLMLGAGVWMFSALKGYSGFDDPYPDFGKLDRAARDLAEDYAALRDDARAKMEAPVAKARDALNVRLAAIEDALARTHARYDEATDAIQALDREGRKTETAGADLIRLYRRENLAARNGTAAPGYFSESPPIEPIFPEVLARSSDLLGQAEAASADARSAAGEELAALVQAVDVTLDKLDGEARA